MTYSPLEERLLALPKTELHLHLEGSIEPATVAELAARHAVAFGTAEVERRYGFKDFSGFLEAFKWVTTLLRAPADYALITDRLSERLLEQNVRYAEVTISVGVMLLRGQDVEANFEAIYEAGQRALTRGLRLHWIFDAVRQFGVDAAMEVARLGARFRPQGVVAFGLGGDELALPAPDFLRVYDYASEHGLHRLIHAGEVGGPESVREAMHVIRAERIGHGIAAINDAKVCELLIEETIPLEICPTSNLRTGALAKQTKNAKAGYAQHPLPEFVRQGIGATISTDDPAMFGTNLIREFAAGEEMGLNFRELARIVRMGIEFAFLDESEKQVLLAEQQNTVVGLL